MSKVSNVELPDFGMPSAMPILGPDLYERRLERLRERAAQRGYSHVIVYADREHSANMSYLTGFDPRFEEALLIVGREGDPAILVGNECHGMAGAAPLDMRRHLFQEFSLPGQPQDRSAPLVDILREEGIVAGARVGVVGWKCFADPSKFDLPSFLIDDLRRAVGDDLESATDLFMDSADGLRVVNEVDQLAAFEYAACHTSNGIKNLLFGLRPGMTEQQAVSLLAWNGMPLSCHLMLSSGPRASFGLLSPTDRAIEHGDRFTVAFGVWGALNCRAGFVVGEAGELPSPIADYVERLVAPYFDTVSEWYAALHVGQRAGVLHDIVEKRLGDPFFGIFLNPGHQIHLDEWVNSPVGEGSQIELRSGMALQCDIIPATGTDYFTTNIEDGIALADSSLRNEIATNYPEMWSRIEARRSFMADTLGIDLHPDVLPFSNLPAYLPPFLLDPTSVMTTR